MKEQIHKVRVKIDGLSQLVKRLESFEEIICELQDKDVNQNLQSPSALMRVVESFSTAPNHKYQGIIKTDYGTFRFGSNSNIDIRQYGLDLKSKEINKCFDSLILAKTWLGKVLFELGDTNPYAKTDGNRKTVDDIEPVSDKIILNKEEINAEALQNCSKDFNLLNYIEKIDWLRQEIEKIKKEIIIIDLDMLKSKQTFERYAINYQNCLDEARFHLGFELQRIKESSK